MKRSRIDRRDIRIASPIPRPTKRTLKKPWQVSAFIEKGRKNSRNWMKSVNSTPIELPSWVGTLKAKGVHPPSIPSAKVNNLHKDELVFVLGNGMSLWHAQENEHLLSDYTKIGVAMSWLLLNSEHLIFTEKSPWVFCMEQLLRLRTCLFYPDYSGKPGWHVPFGTQFRPVIINPDNVSITSRFEDGVSTYSSGITATCLAALMGAKEIALCGIDLSSSEHFYSDTAMFNNEFVRQINTIRYPTKTGYPNAGPRFKIWPQLAGILQKKGIKVWNCSTSSALTCFEKTTIPSLIKKTKALKRKEDVASIMDKWLVEAQ